MLDFSSGPPLPWEELCLGVSEGAAAREAIAL